ncbi:ATP-binding cassette domain-containing protein [Microbacterium karelineae]|uniref:ATP-binding cassette domain-containing protein n=1 Tax=Microbacterium karelineae TaxID=2654283 RepID=UPI001E37A475|nr:ABC transporter ATP-binding protein [Microbacterium karelineae]
MTTQALQPPNLPAVDAASREVGWRRLRTPISAFAIAGLTIAMIAQALATVVSGELATSPTLSGVAMLGALIVGGAVVQVVAQVGWASVIDRAAGRLRRDLLDAALSQPLRTLGEQAVGEVLDRVDDDTNSINNLMRQQWWAMMGTALGAVPMWVVAGAMWWPAWILMPALVALNILFVRPLFAEIARRKVVNEQAWTDHAAAFEEAVAARSDLRTSLGQAFAMRRVTERAAETNRSFGRMVRTEATLILRSQAVLQALLAAVLVSGVALVTTGGLALGQLVTLFLATTMLVGRVAELINQLPQLQEGLGAIARVRQMMQTEPEPRGGIEPPEEANGLDISGLDFSYDEGSFALRDVTLSVPPGETIALVGRTGSGKSTLASLIPRAVEPPRGTVFLGGVDVCVIDLERLRGAIGVVTQRTELLAGTLAENIALFAPVPRERVQGAVRALGLEEWAATLPDGIDTLLGPGGTSLSAGEEQLIAFARLLVRDVSVVVLDEATARMDPVTEARVVRASERLLAGRTGVLIAHRLSTIERADHVAVLDHGRVIQNGEYGELAARPGPFRDLLEAGRAHHGIVDDPTDGEQDAPAHPVPGEPVAMGDTGEPDEDSEPRSGQAIGGRRRGTPPKRSALPDGPRLARSVISAFRHRPAWGLLGLSMFFLMAVLSAQGVVTSWLWGRIVDALESGEGDIWLTTGILVAIIVLVMPAVFAWGVAIYPRWWASCLTRHRTRVLAGQIGEPRLDPTPPGEVVARAMDGDRIQDYADRWGDLVSATVVILLSVLLSGSLVAGAVLAGVLVISALASAIGRPAAGCSAKRAADARVVFGRSLVSALDAARTVKLAARVAPVRAHLHEVDERRVRSQIVEHRVQAVLDGVPGIVIASGVTFAWAAYFTDAWSLATTIMVANAVLGFGWYGLCAGSVVTKAPGTRAWQLATSRLAGGTDIFAPVPGIDEVTGAAPEPGAARHDELRTLELRGLTAIHDDGTIGVEDVNLTVRRGEVVLLIGGIGSGKSSLLASLAGLMPRTGEIAWNGVRIEQETFLRPRHVAHVSQVPRILSGTFDENIRLDHPREIAGPIDVSRMGPDIDAAGGPEAAVGHRGVRLSGGQVQRLALARALATDSEVILADDVSSALDAATELELWAALREKGMTVIGSTSKRAALARADCVVVLQDGRVADTGPWRDLASRWSHLAG